MTMITPSYLRETIEYSSLHACRSTLEDPTCGRGETETMELSDVHPASRGRYRSQEFSGDYIVFWLPIHPDWQHKGYQGIGTTARDRRSNKSGDNYMFTWYALEELESQCCLYEEFLAWLMAVSWHAQSTTPEAARQLAHDRWCPALPRSWVQKTLAEKWQTWSAAHSPLAKRLEDQNLTNLQDQQQQLQQTQKNTNVAEEAKTASATKERKVTGKFHVPQFSIGRQDSACNNATLLTDLLATIPGLEKHVNGIHQYLRIQGRLSDLKKQLEALHAPIRAAQQDLRDKEKQIVALNDHEMNNAVDLLQMQHCETFLDSMSIGQPCVAIRKAPAATHFLQLPLVAQLSFLEKFENHLPLWMRMKEHQRQFIRVLNDPKQWRQYCPSLHQVNIKQVAKKKESVATLRAAAEDTTMRE